MTRDRQFAIPFQLDAADASQAEARLYCSDDAGKNWKLASRAKAPLEAFDFQAAADNEYWFAVRTADMAGRESSTEAPTAEMRVIVDTLPTKLDVKAERTAEGPIVVRWQIDDAHIAPDTLKFSVRADGGSAQEIEPLRSKRRLDRRSASGEMQWVPKPGSKDLMLIAEVRDAADNPTTIEVPLAAAASSAPLATAPQPARLPELAPVATAPAAAPPAGPVASLRDPTKPMLVNSPSFELDYDIEHLGNTPIAKVDIWGTRDRGRNWVLLGPDDDRRSPCAVNVEREGMYGFAVVVTAEGGVQGRIPQPGDVPEINVGVDLSKPKVRFTTAEPSTDGRPCAMQIKWDAADDHLGPQAVTLSYSAAPQGPWKPLVIGIGSSGVHLCEFDPQGPDYAYLKIEVRDEAGNIGSHTTTNAIPIEKRRMQVTFAGATKPEGQSQGPKWFHVLQ
ncbi:MAG: hypothetical protein K8U03_23240 [Planctomycetia bacterium]|nr:hypothetical protein [Planctomycetia bacterium]